MYLCLFWLSIIKNVYLGKKLYLMFKFHLFLTSFKRWGLEQLAAILAAILDFGRHMIYTLGVPIKK